MSFCVFTYFQELKHKGKYFKNYAKILRETKLDKDNECLCLLLYFSCIYFSTSVLCLTVLFNFGFFSTLIAWEPEER